MIRLGFPTSAVYPNSGLTWRNDGKIIFKGKCRIGNDCYIVCGRQGRIEFGDDFRATAGLRMVSECGISFGKHVLIGWGNTIIDTSFHPLYNLQTQKFGRAFGQIKIGDNNWLSTHCMVMHSVTTPANVVFGARTVVTRGMNYEPDCVYGGSPIRVLRRNVRRIVGQDSITDYTLGQ